MATFLLFVLISIVFANNLQIVPQIVSHDPDQFKNVTQVITERGYKCEQHDIITPDGYSIGSKNSK